MRISRVLKIFFGCHCDPAFSGGNNPIRNRIKHFEVAAPARASRGSSQ